MAVSLTVPSSSAGMPGTALAVYFVDCSNPEIPSQHGVAGLASGRRAKAPLHEINPAAAYESLEFHGLFSTRGSCMKGKVWGSPGRAFAPLLQRKTSNFLKDKYFSVCCSCVAAARPWVRGPVEAGSHPLGTGAAPSPQLICDPISR